MTNPSDEARAFPTYVAGSRLEWLYIHSKSLADRAATAATYGSVHKSSRILTEANTLARAIQIIEREESAVGSIDGNVVDLLASVFCEQCDRRVSQKEVDQCRSRWCGARP